MRFGDIAKSLRSTPVRLEEGRARLDTNPSEMGSPLLLKIIGIDEVASAAALAAGGAMATMAATLFLSNSDASRGNRS